MTLLRVGLCPALSQDVLDSLNEANIKTVLDFVCSDLEKLAQVCSVSYKVLVSIRRLLLAQYSSFLVNGTDLYNDVMSTVAILPTGCTSLDELLDGGLYTSEVLEVAGGSGVGKTQLCTSIAASIAVSSEQNVLYIDTSGGFSCQRLQDMMVARNTPEKMPDTAEGKPGQKVRRGSSFKKFGKRLTASFRFKKKHHKSSSTISDEDRHSEIGEHQKSGFLRSLSKRWRKGKKKGRYSVSAEVNSNNKMGDEKREGSTKEQTSVGIKMDVEPEQKIAGKKRHKEEGKEESAKRHKKERKVKD